MSVDAYKSQHNDHQQLNLKESNVIQIKTKMQHNHPRHLSLVRRVAQSRTIKNMTHSSQSSAKTEQKITKNKFSHSKQQRFFIFHDARGVCLCKLHSFD